ncbi:MAG: DNA polymerase IV [Candidatus Levybacteria bacterium]|nr:DNA polymerase IV [Candidatus Levybacteria bacterium]
MKPQKTILHIDFDSYFASCEQQFNPKLRRKPVAVTAQNGRNCIIAASREAKKLGIKSPSTRFEAVQIVPDLIFTKASFERYWEITQKFLDICKDYSPFVELFSLDEVFMDITSTSNLFGGNLKLIERIKERIKDEIGEYITVSVGLSYNKLLAKLGSGMNKPNGFCQISKENLNEVYARSKLTDFCGIGERVAFRLQTLGIHTPLQLSQTSLNLLIREFKDVEGHFLCDLGKGIDESPVVPYYQEDDTKSVGRNYCLPQNQYDKRVVLQDIFELCEEVCLKLRRLNKSAKTGFIYLSGNKSVHGRKTVGHYFDSGKELFEICLIILKENNFSFSSGDYIRRMSIGAGHLQDSLSLTPSLFEKDNKNHKLLGIIDKINEKHGYHTIRNGFLLYGPNLKTVPNGYMADRFERTKLAKNVNF